MAKEITIQAGAPVGISNPRYVVERLVYLMQVACKETYNTENPNEDENIVYPYVTFDADFESFGDTQRSDGVYLDLMLWDRSGSYTKLYEIESDLRVILDKARFTTKEYVFMIKWNRANQIATEQRGLKRLAVQYYIKAESRKKVLK